MGRAMKAGVIAGAILCPPRGNKREEIAMTARNVTRAIAAVIMLFSLVNVTAAQAEQSNSCKQCRDQQQACAKNYSAKTCKAEYDMCLKSCQRK
jgi:hypothetical protein